MEDTVDQINNLISRLELQSDDIDSKGHTDSLRGEKGIESNLLPNRAQMEQYLQNEIVDFPRYESGGIEKVVAEPTSSVRTAISASTRSMSILETQLGDYMSCDG